MYIIAAVQRVRDVLQPTSGLCRHARCPSGGGVARALDMCSQPGVKQFIIIASDYRDFPLRAMLPPMARASP